ncbi:hypothetical protein T4D_16102 [Trichinella pseudospiralis]|uniref:Uncharacterized protein n=1 Tax=Trichinella pseudospiralis TaxID=6337 RepID=A0A0V1DS67_TRIPS|nr:hypothetical protein T4D_16102 [Trichinella pseudospiralis]
MVLKENGENVTSGDGRVLPEDFEVEDGTDGTFRSFRLSRL